MHDTFKVNSKLRKKRRTYLRYEGGCDCRFTAGASYPAVEFITRLISGAGAPSIHTHRNGRRSPLLVHTNDLNREYDPKWNEKRTYNTAEVFDEITSWLVKHVIPLIEAVPVAETKVDMWPDAVAIPWPDSLGPLFTLGDGNDAFRIKKGKDDPTQLTPRDRYGLQGCGYRLLPYDYRNDGTAPDLAREAFKWCGIGEVTAEATPSTVDIPGHDRSMMEKYVMRVTPKRADGIYIADHAPYEKRRTELSAAITDGRTRFTDEECSDFMCARARTITPIQEYKGGFEQPVVLICRELGLDEVEVISGPIDDEL